MLVRLTCIAVLFVVARGFAQPWVVPESELTQAPTEARIAALLGAADRDGWAPQVEPLRHAALAAYERSPITVAEAWWFTYAWAESWARPESDVVTQWITAVNAARVGHPNLPRTFEERATPLAARLSPDVRRWLLSSREFSAEYFANVAAVDYLPGAYEILDRLYRASPTQFKNYGSLALAIALVFDVPPPPHWPHAQVRPEALPRRLPDALEAFRWWIQQEQRGRLAAPLRRRSMFDLKFVVDAAAPFAELEWAQTAIPGVEQDLGRAYVAVKYDTTRISLNEPIWTGRTYRLEDILAQRGICADQAYFATQVGKAKGLPTLLFAGAGNDSWHGWIGYLDPQQQWHLDVGRYAEQKFVTGVAMDPQTWRLLTDHDLQFLRENFHATESFRQSRVHQRFAADFLSHRDFEQAVAAARQALRFEPRNVAAWQTLLEAERGRAAPTAAVERVVREAALAFRRYPDVEALYVSLLVDSLWSRGQTSEAEAEIRRLARNNRESRSDISAHQAGILVGRAMQTQPLTAQIRTYTTVVEAYGPGAGVTFFNEVVRPFVAHLIQLRHRSEAAAALERGRRTLNFQPGSDLDRAFQKLADEIARIPAAR